MRHLHIARLRVSALLLKARGKADERAREKGPRIDRELPLLNGILRWAGKTKPTVGSMQTARNVQAAGRSPAAEARQ
jgi:hypothetical protein